MPGTNPTRTFRANHKTYAIREDQRSVYRLETYRQKDGLYKKKLGNGDWEPVAANPDVAKGVYEFRTMKGKNDLDENKSVN